MEGFAGKPYAEVAVDVIRPFAGGSIADGDLARMVREAYGGFRHPATVPLVQLDSSLFVLELFHGPTLAFKDLAMQLVARLMDHALHQRGERTTIVVATSGDTGGAAAEAPAPAASAPAAPAPAAPAPAAAAPAPPAAPAPAAPAPAPAAPAPAAAAPPAPAPAPAAASVNAGEEIYKFSTIRRAIAKHMMESIGGHTTALVAIVKGNVPYTQDAPVHARAIEPLAKMAEHIFPPDSQTGKTDALPAIWEQPQKFQQALAAFQTAAADLAKAADGEPSDLAAPVGALAKACKGCHDDFRKKN